MQVILHNITADPEFTVGHAAAKCYDGNTERDACLRRTAGCVDKGHLGTLRFAHAHFEVTGISRVCSHQMVRVAHAGILQESQRYVRQSRIEFVDPPALADCPPHFRAAWGKVQADAEALYLSAVAEGWLKKEDARFILPQGNQTSLHIVGNFQFWRDFLKNRASGHAQWEIRDVAYEIRRRLNEHAPRVFPLPKA